MAHPSLRGSPGIGHPAWFPGASNFLNRRISDTQEIAREGELRHLWTWGVLFAAALAAGCGGGTSSTGQLRFMQASLISEQVQLLVNGTQQATNLNYGNATGYLTLRSESQHVQVLPVSGSTTPIFDTSISVNSSVSQTLMMTGTTGAIHSVLLNDANTTSVAGDINVRVVNASNRIGAADVYILPAGSSIIGAVPVANGPFGFDQNTGYQLVASGGYQVVLAVPGTTNAVLSTGTINPASSSLNQTVVVLDKAAGGFTFTVLEDQ